MAKDKIVILVIISIITSSIIFGIIMAYRIYLTPLYVENITETINLLNTDTDDKDLLMSKLWLYNELSRSNTMIDIHTNEERKFTKEEMTTFYKKIGGKESILSYLRTIEDDEIRRNELKKARYQFKIISQEELHALWW